MAGKPHNSFVRPGDMDFRAENSLLGGLQDRFAERLCQMRDSSGGVWRQELQLALDLGRIEDRRELAEVTRACAALKRIGSEPFTDYEGSQAVAWSPDGKLLATHGNNRMRIWNTADRSVIHSWPLAGDIKAVVFGNDGESLFVAGGQDLPGGSGIWGRQVLQRVDMQTGEMLQDFAGNRRGRWEQVAPSAAQDLMVSSDYFGEVAVWKLPEGKLVRHVDVRQGGGGRLSPDGKTLWRSLGYRGSLIEDLLGKQKFSIRCKSKDALFSPDGRLFTLEHIGTIEGKTAGTPEWVERRTEEDFAVLPEADGEAGPEASRFCIPRLSEQGIAEIVSLPREQEVARFEVPYWGSAALSALALSPDGKILAIGNSYSPVRFYRVPSGERLRLPGPTHTDYLLDLSFSTDGKVLHSTGYDHLAIDWDAETLTPSNVWRIEPPYPPEPDSWHNPKEPFRMFDGRSLQLQFPIDRDSLKLPASITDTASGDVIKRRDVDVPWTTGGSDDGLVPGGKYFYLGTQIYDLEKLEFVTGRRLPGCYVRTVKFSADGSRYLVVASGLERENVACLRVLETLSSKTLWYAETTSRYLDRLVFSPDGKKLAWFDGASIQIQQLP